MIVEAITTVSSVHLPESGLTVECQMGTAPGRRYYTLTFKTAGGSELCVFGDAEQMSAISKAIESAIGRVVEAAKSEQAA